MLNAREICIGIRELDYVFQLLLRRKGKVTGAWRLRELFWAWSVLVEELL